jgi:hypothetical protein
MFNSPYIIKDGSILDALPPYLQDARWTKKSRLNPQRKERELDSRNLEGLVLPASRSRFFFSTHFEVDDISHSDDATLRVAEWSQGPSIWR